MENDKNKWGFSRKTNVAIAGIGGIAAANQSWQAIIAVTLIVCLAITYQYWLDKIERKAIK